MNGFILLIPFILIRFVYLSFLDKIAIRRAAHFPPMLGNEKVAYWVYQISNVAIFVYLCFLSVKIDYSYFFYSGIFSYLLGLIICGVSLKNFAKPSNEGLNQNGIYGITRNPIYVSYFVYFIGCVLLTQSLILGIIVLIFQISSHWIILSEERWCIEKFGQSYKQYMKKVRRYI